MAKKDSKPETQVTDKRDERDETVATLDTSEETARLDVDLDADRPLSLPDDAARLDVFRDGNLEGLEKEAKKVAPDGIGEIKDNLGNDIAHLDGPGIADMFKTGNKYGLTGTDETDPLSGQPQIPDDDGAPETPFKDDPSLVSGTDGGYRSWGEKAFGEVMGGSGGGSRDAGTPTPKGGPDPGGSSEGTLEELQRQDNAAALERIKKTSGVNEAGFKALKQQADKAAADKAAADKAAADKAAADKAAADKAAADKAAADKAAADKAAADKAAADKAAADKKGGQKSKEGDDDDTYTTGDVESTPQINTLESGPLLTDHDLLGHRVDPGTGDGFEIDESQIDAVIKEHTTHGTQILTSAEELPATVDLSAPPTIPGSELENTGNPNDPFAPPPPAPGGSTTGPPSGGGDSDAAASAPSVDAATLDAAALDAPSAALPNSGGDFSAPASGAEAGPAPGGSDYDDDLAEGGPFPDDG